jgi:hypothetical protein
MIQVERNSLALAPDLDRSADVRRELLEQAIQAGWRLYLALSASK